MIRLFATAALLAMWTGLAGAVSTPQVWQGEAFVIAVTGACAPNSIAAVGDYYRVVYRPKLAATDPAEGLTFVGPRSIYLAVSLAGTAMFSGTGSYKGTYISSRAATGSTTGAFTLKISPLPILTGTGTVSISGIVTNFFAVTGCDVTFRSAATPRP